MDFKRKYTGSSAAKLPAGYDSEQELNVHRSYPWLQLHPPNKLEYHIDHTYPADFFWGVCKVTGLRVYIECKEWMEYKDCLKYEALVRCNTGIILIILAKSINAATLKRLNGNDRLVAYRTKMRIPDEWLDRVQVCKQQDPPS